MHTCVCVCVCVFGLGASQSAEFLAFNYRSLMSPFASHRSPCPPRNLFAFPSAALCLKPCTLVVMPWPSGNGGREGKTWGEAVCSSQHCSCTACCRAREWSPWGGRGTQLTQELISGLPATDNTPCLLQAATSSVPETKDLLSQSL